MSTQNTFQFIIIGLLLVCGYVYLFHAVSRRITIKISTPMLAAILLFIYAMIAGPVVYIVSTIGSTEMVLFILLMLMSCGILFAAVYGLIQNFRDVNKGMLALFLIYILAVAYVTIFSREYGNESSVYIFRTDLISKAFRTHSLKPLTHMLQNVAMFIPLGILLPFVYPEKLDQWMPVILLAIMTTTLIETLQFFLLLGQADMTDIVANVLGAVIGFAAYRLFRRFSPN